MNKTSNDSKKLLELKRISIGGFELNIESGKWRYLWVEEERILILGR